MRRFMKKFINFFKTQIQKWKKNQFLFEELVKRDFKKRYARTTLGMLWSILSPLSQLLIMRLVFTQLFGRNQPHYTTYLFCGTIVFSFFSESSREGMTSLVDNASIFTKINVPKYLFLFSKNIQCMINFLLILVVFFFMALIDGITFSWRMLSLIYPIVCLVIFNIGTGLVLSALYVFFRDMKYLWSIFLQLLQYVSAIFYQVERFPESQQVYFYANPIYLYIRYFRKVMIDGVIPLPSFHLLMGGEALLVLILGVLLYRKYNLRFLYYV